MSDAWSAAPYIVAACGALISIGSALAGRRPGAPAEPTTPSLPSTAPREVLLPATAAAPAASNGLQNYRGQSDPELVELVRRLDRIERDSDERERAHEREQRDRDAAAFRYREKMAVAVAVIMDRLQIRMPRGNGDDRPSE